YEGSRIGKARGDDTREWGVDLGVTEHGATIVSKMLGPLGSRFRHIHILFGNHLRILFPDVEEAFIRQSLDGIIGLGLLVLLLDFWRINDRKQLAFLHHVPLVRSH